MTLAEQSRRFRINETLQGQTLYRVYGKKKAAKRFKAFDMTSNSFVDNLIHCDMFSDKYHETVQCEVDFLNRHNPEYTFEIRTAKM